MMPKTKMIFEETLRQISWNGVRALTEHLARRSSDKRPPYVQRTQFLKTNQGCMASVRSFCSRRYHPLFSTLPPQHIFVPRLALLCQPVFLL